MALNDPSALGALAALENNGMKNVKYMVLMELQMLNH